MNRKYMITVTLITTYSTSHYASRNVVIIHRKVGFTLIHEREGFPWSLQVYSPAVLVYISKHEFLIFTLPEPCYATSTSCGVHDFTIMIVKIPVVFKR